MTWSPGLAASWAACSARARVVASFRPTTANVICAPRSRVKHGGREAQGRTCWMDEFMPPVGQFASETPPFVRAKLTGRSSPKELQGEQLRRKGIWNADCVGSPKWTTITYRYFTTVKLSDLVFAFHRALGARRHRLSSQRRSP
jgi:hypothetical protein